MKWGPADCVDRHAAGGMHDWRHLKVLALELENKDFNLLNNAIILFTRIVVSVFILQWPYFTRILFYTEFILQGL